MTESVHQRIRNLIEETNDAFANGGGCVNSDYAEFATLAFSEFKTLLRDPSLTRADFMAILRKGMTKSRIKCADNDKACWSAFMAYHIQRAANANADPVQH